MEAECLSLTDHNSISMGSIIDEKFEKPDGEMGRKMKSKKKMKAFHN